MKRSEMINNVRDLLNETGFADDVVAEVERFLDDLEGGFNDIRDKIKSIDYTTLDIISDVYDIADNLSDDLY